MTTITENSDEGSRFHAYMAPEQQLSPEVEVLVQHGIGEMEAKERIVSHVS